MCADTGLLVKAETGHSHRGGAEAIHDDILAMKGEGCMILQNVGNNLSIDRESFQRT
jgi:hypothetical protein